MEGGREGSKRTCFSRFLRREGEVPERMRWQEIVFSMHAHVSKGYGGLAAWRCA